MSEFPLDIVWPKVDTPERLQALANVPANQVIYADDFNKIVRALNELNTRDVFIKSGKTLFLQAPENIAEQSPTIGDWAIAVNGDGNLVIGNYSSDDVDGNPVIDNPRIFEKD